MTRSEAAWHILTGEFPPEPGGVSDYTWNVAQGLASRGQEVHVWTRRAENPPEDPPGVTTHRVAESWSGAELTRLGEALDEFEGPRRLLVQYLPHAFGRRGINLGFGRWLRGRRRRGDEIHVMFHEVIYPFLRSDPPRRWVLAAATRLMARDVLRACRSAFVSSQAWEPLLRRVGRGIRRPITWLPVPSNIMPVEDPEGVAALRSQLAGPGEMIVGTFSTFQWHIREGTSSSLAGLLRSRSELRALILGRGGQEFAAGFEAEHPELKGRLHATGGLEPADLSRHIQACDVMIQFYLEGVTTKRTTLMSLLCHGKPVVSTLGLYTERVWSESGALRLVPANEPTALAAAAEALLSDPAERARIGAEGKTFYDRWFALDRTLDRLEPTGAASDRSPDPLHA